MIGKGRFLILRRGNDNIRISVVAKEKKEWMTDFLERMILA